jgi:Low molecular weight phosphotyrosine protein phosphatase
MAAAFFNQLADRTKAEAVSAGTEPGLRVHPEVLAVMQEVGIDLTGARPQKLTEELASDADLLITMGCGDKCSYVPGLRRDDWPVLRPVHLYCRALTKRKSFTAIRSSRLHRYFSSAAFLFPSPGSSRLGWLGSHDRTRLVFTWTFSRFPVRGPHRPSPAVLTVSG